MRPKLGFCNNRLQKLSIQNITTILWLHMAVSNQKRQKKDPDILNVVFLIGVLKTPSNSAYFIHSYEAAYPSNQFYAEGYHTADQRQISEVDELPVFGY
jgi:hypothetical protein